MVDTLWRDGERGGQADGGRRHFVLAGQRAFLLERIALEPSVSLRRLQAELAERGTVVSYGAVWTFVHQEKLSFKKNRARQRAGSA
jgi:transposase